MLKRHYFVWLAATVLFISGCAQSQNQNTYRYDEVGKSSAISFGTIIAIREIDIIGRNTGAGTAVGAAAGAGAGSYVGSGSGELWAVGAGLLLGAMAGAAAEQAMADSKGIEYTVTLESGITLTVAQNVAATDTPIGIGQRVIVQNSGGYQRVLPAAHLPSQVQRPVGITVVD